ncbi:hypothetical protein V7113_23555 [Priestia megaterium]|uniref:hypothetical protein n=1 Tax=Priestia megaterium TaxID=1404 RepID=UPI000BFD9F53|nr:hypothetical protein [Priestia megaterium]MBZ5482578.1 hypothetical protein [Bacillus sp. T_4]PGZ77361.1 hypothetical protein COE55_17700 [Priestia megaterium]
MNSVKRLDLPFEIKSMGVSYYAPFVAVLLGIMYVTFSSSADVIQYTSIILEFVACPFAAWWSMYLFYDYYEDRASEVLFSYPLSSFFHGIIRVTSFFIVFFVIFFIFLVTITIKHPDISLMDLSILYVPQTILYCYLGFTLMVLSRNIIFPLLILVAYIGMKYWTMGGNMFPVYNVMSFSVDMKISDELITLSIQNIIIGIILAFIGHLILSKRKI